MERTEFGAERTNCSCQTCQKNCRFMPGFLIPADLGRMIPEGADPFVWAENNLLASPGALVAKGLELFRIPTLVPAVKADGSCIHLSGGKKNGLCNIHEIAPFGCAFFDCRPDTPERDHLASAGLMQIVRSGEDGFYHRLWLHLDGLGRRQYSPDVLRQRMAECA